MSLHKRLIKYLVLRILINITVWLNHILILRVISNNQDNRTCKCSIKSNNKMYLKYIITKVNLVKYECFFITIDFLLLTLVNVTVWLNLILMLRVTINNQDDRTFKYFIKSNKKKFKIHYLKSQPNWLLSVFLLPLIEYFCMLDHLDKCVTTL